MKQVNMTCRLKNKVFERSMSYNDFIAQRLMLRELTKIIYFFIRLQQGELRSSELDWSILEKFVDDGATVVDIGSNIGRYTFQMSKIVGKSGKVISIEPNIYSFAILTCLAAWSKRENITLLNICISSNNYLINFLRDTSSPATAIFSTDTRSRIIPARAKNNTINKQVAVTLDSIIESIPIKFIKIDVEGHEYEVLQGSIQTIKRWKPILLIENNNSEDISDLLKEYGYTGFLYDAKGRNTWYIHKNDNQSKQKIAVI